MDRQKVIIKDNTWTVYVTNFKYDDMQKKFTIEYTNMVKGLPIVVYDNDVKVLPRAIVVLNKDTGNSVIFTPNNNWYPIEEIRTVKLDEDRNLIRYYAKEANGNIIYTLEVIIPKEQPEEDEDMFEDMF